MIRSDYRRADAAPGPSRPAALASAFPFVGRSARARALRALLPRAEGEGRRVVLLGGEAGSGKSRLVREFAAEAAERRRARPLRRLRRGRAHALRAVRRGARPARARDRPGRAARRARHRAAASSRGCCPTCGARRRPAAAGRGRPGHRAPPPAHRGRPTCSRGVSRGAAGAARARGRALGRRADALLLRHLARAAGGARAAAAGDVPRHRGRRAGGARRDARRPAPLDDVVRLRLAGLSGDEVAEFVRRAGGRADAGVASSRARSATSPTATPFLVCELWRALVETGASSSPTARSGSPAAGRARHARRACARSSASGSRAWRRATTDLLELAATAGAEFELDVVRRAAGRASRELLAALDEAVAQRDDRGAPVAPARLPLHARARAPRALRPADRGCGGRSCTCASARRSRRAGSARPRARRPRAPLRGRRAVRRRRARRRVQRARARGPRRAALAFDEAAARLRTALELGIEDPAERARLLLELGTASHRAGQARSTRSRRSRRRRRSRASSATRELLARAAIGYEEACWRPAIADQGAVELLEEAAAALGDEDSELRVGAARRARPRARLPGRARARRRVVRDERDRDGARARRPRRRSRRVLMRSLLGARHDARSRRSSRC